jgi:hypothetical protein
VWEGKDIEKRDDWIYRLNGAQREEIHAALNSFKGKFPNRLHGMSNFHSPGPWSRPHQPGDIPPSHSPSYTARTIARNPQWPRFLRPPRPRRRSVLP